MNDENIAVLDDYILLFVQRFPKFGKKSYKQGAKWSTINRALSNKLVNGHLQQKFAIGSLGRWYPEYGAIDIDEREKEEADKIRDKLGLNESNSMLCSSESRDSYHILFRPKLNEKPPTLKRLNDDFKGFCSQFGVEIYPQIKRVFRLPFGKFQECLDYEYLHIKAIEDKLYWFQKLDDFDISSIPKQQLNFNLADKFETYSELSLLDIPKLIGEPKSYYEQGREYYLNGLQAFGTRNDAQFCILYWMWRRNIPINTAISSTWRWIQKRHNGFSKDFPKYPTHVKKEIIRQANYIYQNFDHRNIYPDSTHNNFYGFITKPDIEDIVETVQGSFTRMKFLFSLIKYAYPRKHRSYLNVHTDKLKHWSKVYQKYLNELDEKGIVKRGKAYLVGQFSKHIDVKWPFRNSDEMVLFEGRAVETLEDTIRLLYKPQDFRSILRRTGIPRQNALYIINDIYERNGEEYPINVKKKGNIIIN